MKDLENKRIKQTLIGLTSIVEQLHGSELAMEHLLHELGPTLTPEQRKRISRYKENTLEHRKHLLEGFKKKLSPEDASIFEKILIRQPSEPPSFMPN